MVQNRQILWDLIYIYMNIFINNYKMIENLKMSCPQYDGSRFCCGCCEGI